MNSFFFGALFLLLPVLLAVFLIQPHLLERLTGKRRSRKTIIGVFVGLWIAVGAAGGASGLPRDISGPTVSPTPIESSPAVSNSAELTDANASPSAWMTGKEVAVVKRTVDGDTIELDSGKKLRYIGVDTPETVDPRRAVGCFGKEASAFNKNLVTGKTVYLEKDVSETDKYGRLLRYVYVADENNESIFVNKLLVDEGYARASSYPPDIKYQDVFKAAEHIARDGSKGLWGQACSSQK